jgi:hypothetical protein
VGIGKNVDVWVVVGLGLGLGLGFRAASTGLLTTSEAVSRRLAARTPRRMFRAGCRADRDFIIFFRREIYITGRYYTKTRLRHIS